MGRAEGGAALSQVGEVSRHMTWPITSQGMAHYMASHGMARHGPSYGMAQTSLVPLMRCGGPTGVQTWWVCGGNESGVCIMCGPARCELHACQV